jgi:phage minor structural protein
VLTIKFESRIELWSSSGPIGVLRKAMGVHTPETTNGEYFVTFAYPRLIGDEEMYSALIDDNDVVFPQDIERGQRFRIKKTGEIRQGLKVYKVVEAHHIAMTLGQFFLDDYIDFAAAQPPENLLTLLGNDTPFTFVVEGIFTPQDVFDFGEKSKLELLRDMCNMYGAELSFDNYTITFTTRKGANNGASIRFRKNMKGIQKTVHSMERINRLYGYGKNGLTIEGLPGHATKYIDSSYLDPANPYMGRADFPEVDTQAKLLEEMQKYLAKYELPKVSYEVDFVELEKVDREFEVDRIRQSGDTVTIFDEELGYSFDARVDQRDPYPFEPKGGGATLANFREFKTEDYIFQATVASKKAIVYTSKNAVLKGVKYDDSLTLVDGFGMAVSDDFNRVRIRLGQVGPGDYGMAMYNKAGDKTIWQDATTGDARFKGLIQASAFEGGSITIGTAFNVDSAGHMIAVGADFSGTISASVITGGQINGTNISGADILGGRIRTATTGDRIELDPNGFVFYDSSNARRVTLGTNPVANISGHTYYNSSGVSQGLIYANPNELDVIGNNDLRLGTNSGGTTFLQGPVAFTSGSSVTGLNLGINQISGLQSQLTSLQSQIDSLLFSYNNHNHTVTTAHHNHGNTANAPNTGGGTFTTSTP